VKSRRLRCTETTWLRRANDEGGGPGSGRGWSGTTTPTRPICSRAASARRSLRMVASTEYHLPGHPGRAHRSMWALRLNARPHSAHAYLAAPAASLGASPSVLASLSSVGDVSVLLPGLVDRPLYAASTTGVVLTAGALLLSCFVTGSQARGTSAIGDVKSERQRLCPEAFFAGLVRLRKAGGVSLGISSKRPEGPDDKARAPPCTMVVGVPGPPQPPGWVGML